MTNSNVLQEVELIRMNGGCERTTEHIIRETAQTFRINGEPYVTAMMLAGMEKEFAVGHLYAQGIISGMSDIVSITVTGTTLEVMLAYTKKPGEEPGPVDSDLVVDCNTVFTCVKAILKSDIFAETEAVHSAGLFMEGTETVSIVEDLGRHHALDKVIGAALLQGKDLTRALVTSTGRLPAEMISKCRNAGIPIIATKGVPTTKAVELAKRSGITIAGLVRSTTMFVYSHPERIR
ncbi:MAG: formate dehydrogenase accessory sulfurtransferase FdhD [Deltaproteobacteria bacterium]|nr:formate dehydrogenase accessory sulfurtransferase FdhD [Deltaproteobacteria bacterium]